MRLIEWKDPMESCDLRLTIIPLAGTGIILYAGTLNKRGDYMSLVLKNGYVEYRYCLFTVLFGHLVALLIYVVS